MHITIALLDTSYPTAYARKILTLPNSTATHLCSINIFTVLSCVLVKPVEVRIMKIEKSLYAGVETQLDCHVYGSNPKPVITWKLGTVKLPNTEHMVSKGGANHQIFVCL